MEDRMCRIAGRVALAALDVESDTPYMDRWKERKMGVYDDDDDDEVEWCESISGSFEIHVGFEDLNYTLRRYSDDPLKLAGELEGIADSCNEKAKNIRNAWNAVAASNLVYVYDCVIQNGDFCIYVDGVDSVYKVACDEFDRVMAERNADRKDYIAELKSGFEESEAEFRKRRKDDPEGYGEDEMNDDIEAARKDMEDSIESANGEERRKDAEDAAEMGYEKAIAIVSAEVERIKSECDL